MKELFIIGGGAAGMAAAISAARTAPELSVTVLEAQDRPGRKLLATGNGRCNLTNEDIQPRYYHSQSRKRLAALLSNMGPEQSLDFFQTLGLYCTPDEAGRVYPACRQAAMVRELLELGLCRSRVKLVTNCRVRSITAQKKCLTVTGEDGTVFRAGAVILAAGGAAAPKQGGGSSGYGLAQSLGHSLAPLRPCLVPLTCKGRFFKALKGVRVLCKASLYRNGKRCAVEEGEIQFTDYGLSGIPALQVSCNELQEAEVRLDLLPAWNAETLRQEIDRRCRAFSAEPVEDALLGLIHRRIQYALLKEWSIDPALSAGRLSSQQRRRLAESLKDWRIPVTGTLGWDQAQVTAGGVLLDEVEEDFSSIFEPRLFLAGELLDATGLCGGYNLHWAWCSGQAAGAAAAHLCAGTKES